MESLPFGPKAKLRLIEYRSVFPFLQFLYLIVIYLDQGDNLLLGDLGEIIDIRRDLKRRILGFMRRRRRRRVRGRRHL